MLLVWDWWTAVVNLLHLLTVGLLPFAAGLLGEHIQSTVAFAGYSVIIILVAFSGGLFWLTATRGRGKFVGGISWRQRAAGFIRTTAIGWAFLAGLACESMTDLHTWWRFSWVLLFPLMILARIIAGKSTAK